MKLAIGSKIKCIGNIRRKKQNRKYATTGKYASWTSNGASVKLATVALGKWKNVEIRLPEPREQTVYVVELQRSKKHGLYVTHMQSVPELFGKVLHHWNIAVTYQTLSVKEIKISIECADTLNSFNDDVLEKKHWWIGG